MTSWIYLFAAIFFEIAGTVNLKLSQGFSKFWPSMLIFVCYGISIGFEALAMKELELTIVYALWSAVGIGAIAITGMVFFKESMTPVKLISLALIVVGIIGLNYRAN